MDNHLETIERVVEVIVYIKHTQIPDMDADDIAQEIRLKCWTALDQYNKKQGALYHFLLQVARNHVYNLKRGIWVPNNPPCVRCDKRQKENVRCERNDICMKMRKYRRSMKIKASLRVCPHSGIDQYITDTTLDYDAYEALVNTIGLEKYQQMIDGHKPYFRGEKIGYKQVKPILYKNYIKPRMVKVWM